MYVLEIIFAVLTFALILFHFMLILGKPWGEATMGGKYPGKLPPLMRFFSFVSILISIAFLLTVFTKSGIIFPQFQDISNKAIWVVVGFFVIGTFTEHYNTQQDRKKNLGSGKYCVTGYFYCNCFEVRKFKL